MLRAGRSQSRRSQKSISVLLLYAGRVSFTPNYVRVAPSRGGQHDSEGVRGHSSGTGRRPSPTTRAPGQVYAQYLAGSDGLPLPVRLRPPPDYDAFTSVEPRHEVRALLRPCSRKVRGERDQIGRCIPGGGGGPEEIQGEPCWWIRCLV